MVTSKTVWSADDGRSSDTKQEAERHEIALRLSDSIASAMKPAAVPIIPLYEALVELQKYWYFTAQAPSAEPGSTT